MACFALFCGLLINRAGLCAPQVNLHLEALPESKRGWHADILLSGALRGWVLNGLRFQDAPNTSIHFVTDRGLTCPPFIYRIKKQRGDGSSSIKRRKKSNYDTSKEELQIEGMQFNIPSSQVHEVLRPFTTRLSRCVHGKNHRLNSSSKGK